MYRIGKSISALLTVIACVALSYSPSASAAPAQKVPLTLTQQGRLLDSKGAPIDGGTLVFRFAFYGSATGGTALWTEDQSITVEQGFFSARLGEVTAFPATLFDGSQDALFLGITVGSDSEMTPRQQVTSTPFALLSLNATHAATADLANTASAAVGALDTRLATIETTTGKLSSAMKAYAGTFFKVSGTCNTLVGCPIDISGGAFTSAPVCVITMTNVDSTGYTERMTIKQTTTTTLTVWKGQFGDTGSTMIGNFVCVGN